VIKVKQEIFMSSKTNTLMSLGISIALIAMGIWFLNNRFSLFGSNYGAWDMSNHMMGAGWGMGIVMILFWIAVVAAFGLFISALINNRRFSADSDSEGLSGAEEILNQRYARGEIDKSQFEAIKRDLRQK
jgi:putative membrane protein